jgi:hypothetical protein
MEVKRMKAIVRGTGLFLVAVFALSAGNAAAETTWGPRAGMSFNPDQIALGAHVQLPLATNFYIVPNADVAFGDDAFTISLNGDVAYRFQSESSVRPYLGAGFSYFNFDVDSEGAGDDSISEAGVSILGGVWLNASGSTPFFIEGKFFLSDELPDFKVMAGVNL